MRGTSATTGKALSGIAHLSQSIRDILGTPIGTRVMRRDYGSRLFELIDRPLNADTVLDMIAAVAEALGKWEPRIAVDRVQIVEVAAGRVTINLTGRHLPDGRPITLPGLTV